MLDKNTMDIPFENELIKAQNKVRRGRHDGIDCPCCGLLVKEYHRTLTSSMAYALILISKETERNGHKFFHVEKFLKNIQNLPSSIRGDFPKLVHWGLLEKETRVRADGNPRAGFYRANTLGRLFVEGTVKADSRMVFFNNQSEREFAPQSISIKEALGNRFNYDELMK